MSFDGPDPATHDRFRGIDGAFESSISGFRVLRGAGCRCRSTPPSRSTIIRGWTRCTVSPSTWARALHIFMLVPVGCGMTLSKDIMLDAEEYEAALNWIYDRSQEGRIHLKATCAPTTSVSCRAGACRRPNQARGRPPGRVCGRARGTWTSRSFSRRRRPTCGP